MQPTTLPASEQPSNLARQQQSAVRFIGGILGRAIATVGAALAMRFYIRRRIANAEHEDDAESPEEQSGMEYWVDEVRNEAQVAAATVLAWQIHAGSETGANVGEYLVERANNLAEQNYAASLPQYAVPRSTVTVTDRMTDGLLWRFANFATGALPEPRFMTSIFGNRSDGARFQF